MNGVNWIRRNPLLWLGVALIAAAILLSSVLRVPETEQALVLRFQQPSFILNAYDPREDYAETGAGLGFKIPFVDRVVWVHKRVLNLDLTRQSILSADQQSLEVDAVARYRIVNPVRMHAIAGDENRVGELLRPILAEALREQFHKQAFNVLVSPERDALMNSVGAMLARSAVKYGVQIIDVRLTRADLPQGPSLDSAFDRMRNAREQMAVSVINDGNAQSKLIRDNAAVAAAKTYSDSFGRDPAFYDFYRAMQSYELTFGTSDNQRRGATTILLSPDNDYLREFMGRKPGQ